MDGESVEEVVDNAHRLLPRLRRALLEGSYRLGTFDGFGFPKPEEVSAGWAFLM